MPRFWPFANRLPAALPPTCKAWVLNVMSRTGIRLGMSALFVSANDPAYAGDQSAGAKALEELGWEVTYSRMVNQKTPRPIVSTEPAPAVLAHPGFTPPHSALTPHSGAINDHLFCDDFDEHQKFDLIVLPRAINEENLLSRRLRLQTAGWLSLLAPGGFFVIPQLGISTQRVSTQRVTTQRVTTQGVSAEGTSAENHGLECYLRHLTCFPGDVQILQEQPRLRDLFSAGGWRKSAHRQQPSTSLSPLKTQGLEIASQRNHAHLVLQIPPISHSLSDWENYVEKGLLTEMAACCRGHQQLHSAASDRQNRVAAGASSPEKSPFFNERRKAA
ncbi:hypothetical protein Plim_0711 [Planctopirus limnophila DSM 3776]|uniref:Uncharacterized protein n=1 Tax=Planctopirus limnophila (strain ATCC 43296 / DSM 3776 / IFAM 1008 / Mu 290) TaxID=521674 RepID=D5SRM4_PLAL2|nr:hypothetical protein [Planctopirus limnophila]ADG66558.1 hypothetical protein Plim_0711 [Planctopirus limnophila DSM 3776]